MQIKWQEPADFVREFTSLNPDSIKEDWIFLYSSLTCNDAKSFVCFYPLEVKNDLNFELQNRKYFGYISYQIKNQLEKLPIDTKFKIEMKDVHLTNFALVFEFDHDKKIITVNSNAENFVMPKTDTKQNHQYIAPEISEFQSNMSDKEYLDKVQQIKLRIEKGDLFQANLTRKFYGRINQHNPFELFLELCKINPAEYSAFLKIGNISVLSSSPEKFLTIKNDFVYSKPIKGTANNPTSLLSEKNLAENLMIVDLIRNDFSKIAQNGSVRVEKLFDISKHPNLYHLSSLISCKKLHDKTVMDVIKATFPAGSMTGAPKIKAMEICSEMENYYKRGIYSGAIGFVGDSDCELSVVIRTLIINTEKGIFEFQVGGGITALSKPQEELDEIMIKAKSIMKLLKILT